MLKSCLQVTCRGTQSKTIRDLEQLTAREMCLSPSRGFSSPPLQLVQGHVQTLCRSTWPYLYNQRWVWAVSFLALSPEKHKETEGGKDAGGGGVGKGFGGRLLRGWTKAAGPSAGEGIKNCDPVPVPGQDSRAGLWARSSGLTTLWGGGPPP